jgi:4-hydroxyphenylpyruvate dioxygenase
MPGEGDLPVTDFTAGVAGTGYDGYFSLEIFNDQFRRGQARSIAADGRRSLIYLGDQVRRAPGTESLTIASMPDRASVS